MSQEFSQQLIVVNKLVNLRIKTTNSSLSGNQYSRWNKLWNIVLTEFVQTIKKTSSRSKDWQKKVEVNKCRPWNDLERKLITFTAQHMAPPSKLDVTRASSETKLNLKLENNFDFNLNKIWIRGNFRFCKRRLLLYQVVTSNSQLLLV